MSSGMEGYADLVHTPKVNTYNLKEMGLHVPYSNMDNIDWCPDPLQFEVKIDGIKRSFSPNMSDYIKAGIDLELPISGDRCLDQIIYVLRYLVDQLNPDQIFYPTNVLLDYVGRPANLQPFLYLYEWCHPGMGSIQKPSDSPCLQSLAKAIAYTDSSLYSCDQTMVNTHWSSWSEFLES